MKAIPRSGGLVYSTDSGRMCPSCRLPTAACVCKASPPAPVGDGTVLVSRETKGRAGKGVTVVRGLVLDVDRLADLARRLRTACGAGGTVREGVVEVQGDHRERVVELLRSQGHRVKVVGG